MHFQSVNKKQTASQIRWYTEKEWSALRGRIRRNGVLRNASEERTALNSETLRRWQSKLNCCSENRGRPGEHSGLNWKVGWGRWLRYFTEKVLNRHLRKVLTVRLYSLNWKFDNCTEYWKFYSKSDYIKIAPSYSTDLIAVFIQSQIYLPQRQKYAFTTFYSSYLLAEPTRFSQGGLDVIHSCATALQASSSYTCKSNQNTNPVQILENSILQAALWSKPEKAYWFLLVMKSICKTPTTSSLSVICWLECNWLPANDVLGLAAQLKVTFSRFSNLFN